MNMRHLVMAGALIGAGLWELDTHNAHSNPGTDDSDRRRARHREVSLKDLDSVS